MGEVCIVSTAEATTDAFDDVRIGGGGEDSTRGALLLPADEAVAASSVARRLLRTSSGSRAVGAAEESAVPCNPVSASGDAGCAQEENGQDIPSFDEDEYVFHVQMLERTVSMRRFPEERAF
jgi:hypothetical protein